ncbi:hypothetical protein R4L22_00380 [Brachyspira pilosicoli]|uniref:hypothetical protein n=1 Tax=Brachyspira pilosicoli TaxID=52584 RepID=UPI0012F5267B|nr:hypothetical protein [Brachyspira pilosicoli]
MRAEICPSDYALDKDSFKKVININNSTLYIVGGLYGNIESLKEINKMIENEKDKDILLIFNGDMHWFDKSADDFKKIEDMSENSQKLLGNVEKELFREGDYNGCGCSYPSYVSDDIVNRSNIIHKELKKVMDILPKYKNILSGRKKNITVEMMGQKIAITHGDEKSLSGWECSNESLERYERQNELDNWFIENDIDILASTHTCFPAAVKLKNGIVINNGAAGMPNFKGKLYGLITRISNSVNENAVYRDRINNLYAEAVPVRYDNDRFLKWFDNLWPLGSEASVSYRDRIINGTEYGIEKAVIKGFQIL